MAQPLLFAAIATAGRREVLAEMLVELTRQTRRPDAVVICPATSEDFDAEGAARLGLPIVAVAPKRGSCKQRNAIIEQLAPAADGLLTFFDDDFFPACDYLAATEALFAAEPDIVAASGHVLADGVTGPGIPIDEARTIIERHAGADAAGAIRPVYNGYGCNMTFRLGVIHRHGLRFDEDLPLYGWLEDVDFSRRIARHGRIVQASAMRGVHLGTKGGRSSGLRIGYSQIANPWHLLKKRTMRADRAVIQAARNVAANTAGTFRPEPWVDRRGRLHGNALALRDLCLGRLHPRNILSFD
jgi:Glycosyltransferase like family 2